MNSDSLDFMTSAPSLATQQYPSHIFTVVMFAIHFTSHVLKIIDIRIISGGMCKNRPKLVQCA